MYVCMHVRIMCLGMYVCIYVLCVFVRRYIYVYCLNSSADLLAMSPINQHVNKEEMNFISIYNAMTIYIYVVQQDTQSDV